MLQKIRFRLIYNRKKQLNSEGKALVQVECLQNGRRSYFSTRVYVKPEQWENGFVVNHPLSDDLNAYIYQFILDMQKVEFDFIRHGSAPTLAQLRNAVLNSMSASAPIADFINSVNKHSANRGKHTLDSYQTLIKHISRFQYCVISPCDKHR